MFLQKNRGKRLSVSVVVKASFRWTAPVLSLFSASVLAFVSPCFKG